MTQEGMKFDVGKHRISMLLSRVPNALNGVLSVLAYGAIKYKEHNWIRVPEWRTRYHDAALRHLLDAQSGLDVDSETGKHHLAHAACCMLFVADFESERSAKTGVSPEMYEALPALAYPAPMQLLPPQAILEAARAVEFLTSGAHPELSIGDAVNLVWMSAGEEFKPTAEVAADCKQLDISIAGLCCGVLFVLLEAKRSPRNFTAA